MTESATNTKKIKITHLMTLVLLGAASASWALAAESQSGFSQGFQQGFGAAMSTPAVGDYEHPNQLSWARLSCPPGEYIVGVSVRQGGWLAQVGARCAAPSSTGGWASQPESGGAAGGEYGTHSALLTCPRGRWVTGVAGLTVRVGHMEGLIERLFLADPILSCGAPGLAGVTTVRDIQFQREKGSALDLAPARYEESQAQYCTAGTYAASLDAAVEPEHHPDIKAVRLNCLELSTKGVRQRSPG